MMFEKVVKKYFDDVEDYLEDKDGREVSFKVMWEEVNYDDLKAISLIMGTKMINFHKVRDGGGYCETCGWDKEYTKVVCTEVRFSEQDADHGDECAIVKGADVKMHEGEVVDE